MSMTQELPIYALDIETTGLYWEDGRITTVAVYSEQVSAVFEDANEKRLLRHVRDMLEDLERGVIATWNGAVFDGPWLASRSKALGIGDWTRLVPDPSITPKYEPQPGFDPVGHNLRVISSRGGFHRHLDVAYAWKDRAESAGVKWSLKPVARSAGISVIEVDRASMEILSVAERMAYNLSDVVATYELAKIVLRQGGEE